MVQEVVHLFQEFIRIEIDQNSGIVLVIIEDQWEIRLFEKHDHEDNGKDVMVHDHLLVKRDVAFLCLVRVAGKPEMLECLAHDRLDQKTECLVRLLL